MMTALYLDYTATTPVLPAVADAMRPWLTDRYGNPSSPHQAGVDAARAVESARSQVLAAIGLTDSHRCVFTSGGSEGNSQVMQWLLSCEDRSGNVVVSAMEHNSIRSFIPRLKQVGYEVREVFPGKDGTLAPETVARQVDASTRLVSIMGVNNETGFVFDVATIARAVKAVSRRIRVHCDWVQGFLKIPADLGEIDFITVSAHKIFGPKGTGAILIRKPLPLPALIGGSHEGGTRGGTHNVAGIVGFSEAVQRGMKDVEERLARARTVRDRFRNQLKAALDRFQVVDGVCQSPYILGLVVDGIRSEVVVRMLSETGVYVSAGSACSTRESVPNHSAAVLNIDPDHYLRISTHAVLSDREVDRGAAAVAEAVQRFRSMTGA